MNAELYRRRKLMLKNHGEGFSLTENVRFLSEKFRVSERICYADWQKRAEWLPILLDIKDVESYYLSLLVTHNEIYKKVVDEYLKAESETVRISSLRLLRDLNLDRRDLIIVQDQLARIRRLEDLESKR